VRQRLADILLEQNLESDIVLRVRVTPSGLDFAPG
jgi:hypothetical protein